MLFVKTFAPRAALPHPPNPMGGPCNEPRLSGRGSAFTGKQDMVVAAVLLRSRPMSLRSLLVLFGSFLM